MALGLRDAGIERSKDRNTRAALSVSQMRRMPALAATVAIGRLSD
jgi:hypothetical protein